MTMIPPRMPVAMTKVAVSDGRPPNASDTPIATAAVTDFGAREISAVSAPPTRGDRNGGDDGDRRADESAAAIGNRLRLTIGRLL